MATLQDLVTTLSWATAVPAATVFAYGRFAREAGLISQGGRGLGGARMNVRDAANLVIALGGSAITREAGATVNRFRQMQGTIYAFRLETRIMDWLSPLGVQKKSPDDVLSARFGKVLEFLIEEAGSGRLHAFLSSIPSVTLPDENSPSSSEILLSSKVEQILRRAKKGTVEDRPAVLHIEFERSTPMARIRLERWWGVPETVMEIDFYPGRAAVTKLSRPMDLFVTARFSAVTLRALAITLADREIPQSLSYPVALSDLSASAGEAS
jgi:hypothetical protein